MFQQLRWRACAGMAWLSLALPWVADGQELIATPLGVACPDGANCVVGDGVISVGQAAVPMQSGVPVANVLQVQSGVPLANEVQAPPLDVTKTILTLEEWERLNESAPPAPVDNKESRGAKRAKRAKIARGAQRARGAKRELRVEVRCGGAGCEFWV